MLLRRPRGTRAWAAAAEKVVGAAALLGMTEAEAGAMFDELDADGSGELTKGEQTKVPLPLPPTPGALDAL